MSQDGTAEVYSDLANNYVILELNTDDARNAMCSLTPVEAQMIGTMLINAAADLLLNKFPGNDKVKH